MENGAKTTATADDTEDNVLLANLKTYSIASAAPMSLQDILRLTLKRLTTSRTPQPRSGNSNLDVLIRKKMNYLESSGLQGAYLQFAFSSLMTVAPTSVEAELAFSAAGYLVSKIRSRLSDKTIYCLIFLRSYFRNNT